MSNTYGVCRLRKYKRGAVRGIETHVERRATISNTNPNIERSHSSQNYDLNGRYDDTFNQQINERFADCGIEKKKLRKDAVVVAELLFTASHDFFSGKSDDEVRQYFTDCYEYACKKFGKENIISAMVHLDETTPHMHLCFVPIKDNKLNVHSYFATGKEMSALQDEVHQKVFSKYGLERGDKNRKAKHIETLDWKIEQLTEKYNNLKELISKTEDEHELLKLNRDLKKTNSMLNDMFKVLENNPQLMAEYKKAIEEMQRRKTEDLTHEL